MDLNSIEATSVAIRTGQVAAAELCNLLTHDEEDVPRPIEDWFDPRAWPATADEVQARIHELAIVADRLGGYVCHAREPVAGERLYRWAVHENTVRRGEWGDLPFAQRQAFEVFALTTRNTYQALRGEQDRLKAATDQPHQLGLALEDSIFEPEESLGALREEAVAAAPMIERVRKGQEAAEARKPAKAAAAAEAAAAAPAPALSVGEAPVKPAVNRGGRGNRKSG